MMFSVFALIVKDDNELCGVFSTYEKAEQEIIRSFEDRGKEFHSLEEWKRFFSIKEMPIDKSRLL